MEHKMTRVISEKFGKIWMQAISRYEAKLANEISKPLNFPKEP